MKNLSIFLALLFFTSSVQAQSAYCLQDFLNNNQKICVPMVVGSTLTLKDNTMSATSTGTRAIRIDRLGKAGGVTDRGWITWILYPGLASNGHGTSIVTQMTDKDTSTLGVFSDSGQVTVGNKVCGYQSTTDLSLTENCDLGTTPNKYCTPQGLVTNSALCVNQTTCAKFDIAPITNGGFGTDSQCQFIDPCVSDPSGLYLTANSTVSSLTINKTCTGNQYCYMGVCETAGTPGNACIFTAGSSVGSCNTGLICNATTGTCAYTDPTLFYAKEYDTTVNQQTTIEPGLITVPGAIVTCVVTGVLPPGFTINPSTCVISGKSAKAGSYPFTVTATDSNGSSTKNVTVVIKAPVSKSRGCNTSAVTGPGNCPSNTFCDAGKCSDICNGTDACSSAFGFNGTCLSTTYCYAL
ncbi:MAG: Ig domain-containing protein [Myxococcaceae bacterium]